MKKDKSASDVNILSQWFDKLQGVEDRVARTERRINKLALKIGKINADLERMVEHVEKVTDSKSVVGKWSIRRWFKKGE